MSVPKFCLVACYLGSWPDYIDLFLEGCRYNPSVDFLLFSDCGPLPDAPSNVEVVPTTKEDVRHRAEERLGVDPAIPEPFSLCDFKPTYGALFSDYLDAYDFWGCTDIDLIYGDIRSFITEPLLREHDVIAARPYLTGFFFLFRNEERINHLYKRSRDWPHVVEQEDHYSFTECNFQWGTLLDGGSIFDVETEIESMTEVIRREEQAGLLRAHFADWERMGIDDTPFTWDQGRLTEGDTARLLLHFNILKNEYYFSFPDWEEVPDRFHVLPTGFYRDHETSGLRYLLASPTRTFAGNWVFMKANRARHKLTLATRSVAD
ncbi:DUF6625 family protein [Salinibacter ruber]|uniref:Uncharacterized protein n=1 Tax=Salinibacter ruber TaxID=146919 RepID=A0A9X2Q5V6_9BACT|nr:DUF6625 family protein [Salinibacter ruber]MCS3662074.1 hypothetical protein [Salinibacter ruber]MCS3711871.1 hypothetical protein [Salinibacter ruber]